MKSRSTTARKRRFVLLMGVCFWGGLMFLLFNFSFIKNTHNYTEPYVIFRLVLSAAIFGAGGFFCASRVAKRFGMS
jgi:hypothetical protein